MEPTVSPSVVTIVPDSVSAAASALDLPSVAVSSTVVMSSMDTQLSSEVRDSNQQDAVEYEHRPVSTNIICTDSESEVISSTSKPRHSEVVESGARVECRARGVFLGDEDYSILRSLSSVA
jgi:hypothetical protein